MSGHASVIDPISTHCSSIAETPGVLLLSVIFFFFGFLSVIGYLDTQLEKEISFFFSFSLSLSFSCLSFHPPFPRPRLDLTSLLSPTGNFTLAAAPISYPLFSPQSFYLCYFIVSTGSYTLFYCINLYRHISQSLPQQNNLFLLLFVFFSPKRPWAGKKKTARR